MGQLTCVTDCNRSDVWSCLVLSGPVWSRLVPSPVVLPAQVLTHLAGANGSVVLSWTEAGAGDKAGAGDEAGAVLLGYVVEWRSGSGVLGWQRVSREQRSTSITGT